ncbi:MAG: hypothetical protein CFE46_12620 [Burkholderiales bacterium PBB6]|nr:MAG: hypothetical protein CFE46_12620 [Burkholderiales bacterium PBB6]
MADQAHDNRPVDGRSTTSNEQKPGDAPLVGALGDGTEAQAHGAREHNGADRTLCLCVDDFGLCAGIDDAVLRLNDAGTVHAVACMVGAPLWRSDGPELRSCADLETGLHLDFTEHPLQVSRRGLGALIVGSHIGALNRVRIRDEIKAQLDAFETVMGRPPDFVDGHQHVHQLPTIREALIAELLRRYGALPWLRSTRRRTGGATRVAERFKAWFIEQVGARALASQARAAGCAQNERLLGVYDFSGGAARYQTLLTAWIASARPGDLLMCHPSSVAEAKDPLGLARLAEFEVLSRPGHVAHLAQGVGLRLGRPHRRSDRT